ncbi:hypothetical protein D3C76_479670 [compost metagenome]
MEALRSWVRGRKPSKHRWARDGPSVRPGGSNAGVKEPVAQRRAGCRDRGFGYFCPVKSDPPKGRKGPADTQQRLDKPANRGVIGGIPTRSVGTRGAECGSKGIDQFSSCGSQSRVRSTAFNQPAYKVSFCCSSSCGLNSRSITALPRNSSRLLQKPHARPAR